MTQSDPGGHHDWHSATYVQDWIGVDGRDHERPLLRRIAHLVPFDVDAPIRILDIDAPESRQICTEGNEW